MNDNIGDRPTFFPPDQVEAAIKAVKTAGDTPAARLLNAVAEVTIRWQAAELNRAMSIEEYIPVLNAMVATAAWMMASAADQAEMNRVALPEGDSTHLGTVVASAAARAALLVGNPESFTINPVVGGNA